jgi:hypothetical protein
MAVRPQSLSKRGVEYKIWTQQASFGDAHTTNLPSNGYNQPQNAETFSSPEALIITTGIVDSTLISNLEADTVQGNQDIDATAGVHMVNLSYNPITDQYKICEGEAVC